MANESDVLVRMRLIGAAAMARDAKAAERALQGIDRRGRGAGQALGSVDRFSGFAQRSLRGIESTAASVARGLGRVERAARVAVMAGGALAAAGGFLGIRLNAQFQQLNTSFATLLGNRKRAEAFVESMRQGVSAGTPFRLTEILDFSRGLIGAGMEAEKLPKRMRAIASAVMAVGGDAELFGRVSEVLGVIQAQGKISAREVNRLAQAGLPVRQLLRKELGLTAEEVANIGRAGIDADEAIEAITRGWARQFGDAAEEARGDWNIQMADLKKDTEQFLRLATEPLFGFLNRSAMPTILRELRVGIKLFSDEDLSVGERMEAVVRRLGARTVMGIGSLFGADISSTKATAAVQSVIDWVANAASTVGDVLGGLFERIPAIAETVAGVVRRVIEALAPAMPFLQNVLVPFLRGVLKGAIGAVVIAFEIAIPVIATIAKVLGWIGKRAEPLVPVIEKLGMVVGFIFGGTVIRIIGAVAKGFAAAGGIIGKVGAIVALAARVASIPLQVLGRVVLVLVRAFGFLGRGVMLAARSFDRGLAFVRRWVGFMRGLPGVIGRIVVNMIARWVNLHVAFYRGAFNLGRRVVAAFGRFLGGLPGRIWSWMSGAAKALGGGRVLQAFINAAGRIGKAIVDAIVEFIKSSPGKIADAVASVVPGPIRRFFGGGSSDRARQLAEGIANRFNIPGGGSAFGGSPRGWGLVGELGPELVRFPAGSRVHPNARSRSLLDRASASVHESPLYANLVVNLDGRVVHRQVHRVERALAEAR